MTVRTIFASIGLFSLAACGGGGGGGNGAPTFAQLDAEASSLAAALAGAPASTSIPTSSTGQYEGVIVMTDSLGTASDGFIGDVFLQANFAGAGSLTGTAGGFFAIQVDTSGNPEGAATPVGGALDFSASSLSPGSNGIVVAVTGNLDINGGNNTISGSLDGNFGETSGMAADGNADLIVLEASGTGLTVGGGGAIGDLDAALIAIDN